MAESFDAVYENGVFKPLEEVNLIDGLRVHLTISPPNGPLTPEQVQAVVRLGRRVFEGLTEDEIAEIQADILGKPFAEFYCREGLTVVRCLLDTDIASEILKAKNANVIRKANSYLQRYGSFAISLMTCYEILRGFQAKQATRQLHNFETWCQVHLVLPITDDVIVAAADFYGRLKRTGRIIGDNDLIIAATALDSGLGLATGNTAHFRRIPGLTLEDWTKP